MLKPYGEIQFKPRSLLRVDGLIIERDMIYPSELHNFINASANTIATRVDELYQRDKAKSKRPELKLRPVIYIARLSLLQTDRSVFDTPNLEDINTVTTNPEILVPEAKEYWDAVRGTPFLPEIHIRGKLALEGTSGVWLSLKSPIK